MENSNNDMKPKKLRKKIILPPTPSLESVTSLDPPKEKKKIVFACENISCNFSHKKKNFLPIDVIDERIYEKQPDFHFVILLSSFCGCTSIQFELFYL